MWMLSDITLWYHNFYTMEVKTFMVYTLCIKVMKERVNDYQIALGSDYLKKWSISHTNPMTLKLVMRRLYAMDIIAIKWYFFHIGQWWFLYLEVPSETLSTFPLVLYYIFAINNECCGSSGHSHHLQKAIDAIGIKNRGA